MKKLMLVVIFTLLSSVVFAQGNLLDIDGYDWVRWTSMEKEKYAIGWLSSLDALINLIEYWQENYTLTEESTNVLKTIRMWSFYEKTSANDVVLILNRTYIDPAVRKYKIWDVLLTLYDKEWWE